MSKNMLDGGQVIVDYLVREKVPYVFGLCGHGNIEFIDALYERSDDIKTISVHHETVAGFMADVYYRVCGKPTATFTSCGPGSANLPIALANAYLDLGAVPGGHRQRADQPVQPRRVPGALPPLPGRFSLHRARLLQAGVPADARRAWCRSRCGRRGRPWSPAGPGRSCSTCRSTSSRRPPPRRRPKPEDWNANISCRCGADPEGVTKAVDMLLAAERPVILVGQGVKYGGAAEELLQLAERLHSGGLVGERHRRHRSHASARARPRRAQRPLSGQPRRAQADVLLALGVRFDDRTSSSWLPGYSFTIPPTKLIHVDIDPDEIARNYPVALGLMADVRTFLRQVLAELDRASDRGETPSRAREMARRPSTASARNGTSSSRPASPTMQRRSIRSAPPTRSTRRCRRTRSWSATSACTTTG